MGNKQCIYTVKLRPLHSEGTVLLSLYIIDGEAQKTAVTITELISVGRFHRKALLDVFTSVYDLNVEESSGREHHFYSGEKTFGWAVDALERCLGELTRGAFSFKIYRGC